MTLLSLACAAAPPPPPPPPIEGPTVNTLLGEATGVAFLGDWTSASCGGRAHARNLRFEENHEYAGIDLVSPCPSGVTCAWSGMVLFAGSWRQDGKQLHLHELTGEGKGSPHPSLVEANGDGNLVESGCIYTRGLTVLAGYTEDRVRPRPPGK